MGFHTASSVGPGEVKSFSFDASYVLTSTTDRSKGIVVTAEGDKKLIVYGANEAQFSTDAFLALSPQTGLGDYKYIGVSYAKASYMSMIAIVSTEDSTVLSVTPSQDITIGIETTPSGGTTTIRLNRTETLLIQAEGDLTGTVVTSSKAISFFSGHECVNIPHNAGACDLIVEQFPPVTCWGRKFATAPLKEGPQLYDKFRIISGKKANSIRINCTEANGIQGVADSFTLGEADHHDIDIPSTQYCWIEGTKRTMLVQFSVGQSSDSVPTDPFMSIVPPCDQYSSKYTLVTVPQSVQRYKHHLNLFIGNASYQPDDILLNGRPISSLDVTYVPIWQFGEIEVYAARIDIAGGVQTIEHNSSKTAQIGVIVYGYGQFNSYGYPGGLVYRDLSGEWVSCPTKLHIQSL